MTADPTLDRLVKLARETYIRERQQFEKRRTGLESYYTPSAQWDGAQAGRGDRFGRNTKPVWPSIVEFALRYDVPVDDLIRARFASWTGRQAPNPTDCKTEQAVTVALRRAEQLGASVDSALATERGLARTEMFFRSGNIEKYGWKPEDVIESLVVDQTVGLSPLFRVIMATENGRPDLADMYLQGAVDQYLRARRFYDASGWGHLIPEVVRTAADRRSVLVPRRA